MAKRTSRSRTKPSRGRAPRSREKPAPRRGGRRAALKIDPAAPLQVFINPQWREYCQASIVALRRHPAGGHAWAAFLVDLGMTGLKDAFGDLDGSPDEFRNLLETMAMNFEMAPTSPQEALRLIAGGMRYARQYGFRLPHDAERWAAVIGPLGDWANDADTSDFIPEFASTVRDLELRLVGSTPEEFLRRNDVDFIFAADDFSLLDEAQTEYDQMLDAVRERAVDAVRQWCFATGREPHPRLADAWDMFVQGVSESVAARDDELPEEDPEPDNPNGPITTSAADGLSRLLSLQPPADREQLAAAFDQVAQCVAAQPDPMAFLTGLDMGGPD